MEPASKPPVRRRRSTDPLLSARPWGIDPLAFAGVFHRLEERLFASDPRVLARAAWNYGRDPAAETVAA